MARRRRAPWLGQLLPWHGAGARVESLAQLVALFVGTFEQ